MKNVVLIGMPGSGKSTVGRMAAQVLGLGFLDTDHMVEEAGEMPIPQMFQEWGEAKFRDLETQMVKAAAQTQGNLIATGGGVILREENMAALAQTGEIVFLNRSPRDIVQAKLSGRPLMDGDGQKVFDLYESRIALYRRYATHTVQSGSTARFTAALIYHLFKGGVG